MLITTLLTTISSIIITVSITSILLINISVYPHHSILITSNLTVTTSIPPLHQPSLSGGSHR